MNAFDWLNDEFLDALRLSGNLIFELSLPDLREDKSLFDNTFFND